MQSDVAVVSYAGAAVGGCGDLGVFLPSVGKLQGEVPGVVFTVGDAAVTSYAAIARVFFAVCVDDCGVLHVSCAFVGTPIIEAEKQEKYERTGHEYVCGCIGYRICES